MAEIHYAWKAVEDLTLLWNYTREVWSERQADQYYRILIATCHKLFGNPLVLGRRYTDIAEGLLGFKAGRHVIFYRMMENGDLEVIRILHERMDLKNRIEE